MTVYVVCFFLGLAVALLGYALVKTLVAKGRDVASRDEEISRLRASLDSERLLAKEKEKIHAETEESIAAVSRASTRPLDEHVRDVRELLHAAAEKSRST